MLPVEADMTSIIPNMFSVISLSDPTGTTFSV